MKGKIKKSTKIMLVLIVMIICISIYIGVVYYFYNRKSNNQSSVSTEETILTEKLYSLNNYPKVDASLATQPLANAFIENFTGQSGIDEKMLDYSNTHPAYVKLINDEVDLIIVTEPSEDELKLAKDSGVELEVIPVVKEGFVFYVNSNNSVNNLSTKQIQDIYSGKITNWKDVGGDAINIKAFQRPVNSGSQTGMLSLVMKGIKLMEPPKENLVATMAEIINMVSNYDNGKDAIGYSYYYYATTMFKTIDENVASNIKLLDIDGVEPNNKTIQDSSYPFTTAYYIVINKADDENSASRILANQMLSKRGQQVAEEAGYVPVNNEV